MKPSSSVLIISFRDDFHAVVIRHTLLNTLGVSCSILEIDSLSYSPSLNINVTGVYTEFEFLDSERVKRSISEFSVVWWRRSNRKQIINHSSGLAAAEIDVINSDTNAAFRGALLASFEGAWINHPIATSRAEDKILQLKTAAKAGFRIPKTLISQDFYEIRNFISNLGGKAIIKSLRGTHLRNLLSILIGVDQIEVEMVSAAPAIYQECIEGTDHLRIQVFGEDLYSVKLSSQELDWRGNLNIPAEMHNLEDEVREKIYAVMKALQLEMGVIDLKLTPAGEHVWLEINPQGQFLFLEAMTKFDFKLAFAKFLSGRLI